MVWCALLYVHSSFASRLGRELVALFGLFSWCLVRVVWLFLVVTRVCLQFVIVVFTDHTQLLFLLPIMKATISTKKQGMIKFLLLRYSVLFTVESLSLLYLLLIPRREAKEGL